MKLPLALGCCLPALLAQAQTSCSLGAPDPGVRICFPAAGPSGSAPHPVPEIFHLSAQANAPAGQTVARFLVSLDGHRIYEERLATPRQQLSIEVNLKSPYSSGTHDLQLTIPGAGSAERKALPFTPAGFIDHCNPDIGGITRSCFLMRLGGSLDWSVPAGANYASVLSRFDRNLRGLEEDTADAVALDPSGHLYTASHVYSDIELRKYDDRGSMVYDSLVRACGPGFTQVAALAVDGAGHAWLAVNSDACFDKMTHSAAPRGLLFELDTARPSSAPALYSRQAGEPGEAVRALRFDPAGFLYLAATNTLTPNGFERKLALDGSPAGSSSPQITPPGAKRVLALASTPGGSIAIVHHDRRLILTSGTCQVALPDVAEVALQPALDAFVAQKADSPCH